MFFDLEVIYKVDGTRKFCIYGFENVRDKFFDIIMKERKEIVRAKVYRKDKIDKLILEYISYSDTLKFYN